MISLITVGRLASTRAQTFKGGNMRKTSKLSIVQALIFILLIGGGFTSSAPAADECGFQRMWPVLAQPWYFNKPNDVAIDHEGNIYLVDSRNHRIQKFTFSGEFITKWGNWGTGEGEFETPEGIAVDSAGDVYVVDRGTGFRNLRGYQRKAGQLKL